MSELDIVNAWLFIAHEDYNAAQHSFDSMYAKPCAIICYHCQQAVEKSLKAFLCVSGLEEPKTHELDELCRRCMDIDAAFSAFLADCADLKIYATNIRYPSRIEVDDTHAKRALFQAKVIYHFVLEQVKTD